MVLKIMNADFKDLSKDYDLRADSKFFVFINKNKFKLIKTNSKGFIKFKKLLISERIPFNYENGKKYKGLQTAKGYIDEEGNIIDFFEATKEKHPYRLRFLAKENQIVISSLKGAKIPTFKISKGIEGYVLSDGFYIFRISNGLFNKKFLYYILKSKELRKILDDNLSRGIGISSYKERDLLRIEIPLVSIAKQEKIVKELEEIEDNIFKLKTIIPDVQKIIEKTFKMVLGYKSTEEYIKIKTEFFNMEFREIGRRKNLRCGAKYNLFWKNYKGVIFESSNKHDFVKLKELMQPFKAQILKKGYLDKKYILLDKEDVEPKTGIIKEESYIEKIESDKILFGNSELLISKLRPYLGHVIINQREKPYIGTTEFLPFIINKNKTFLEFLKYVFLSDVFLKLSTYLMAGKEHPRITAYELLILKIPLPPLLLQARTLETINSKLGTMKELKQLRNKMNSFLIDSLK